VSWEETGARLWEQAERGREGDIEREENLGSSGRKWEEAGAVGGIGGS
jgi:hypothetical protein